MSPSLFIPLLLGRHAYRDRQNQSHDGNDALAPNAKLRDRPGEWFNESHRLARLRVAGACDNCIVFVIHLCRLVDACFQF
jgi:hypothetical protein